MVQKHLKYKVFLIVIFSVDGDNQNDRSSDMTVYQGTSGIVPHINIEDTPDDQVTDSGLPQSQVANLKPIPFAPDTIRREAKWLNHVEQNFESLVVGGLSNCIFVVQLICPISGLDVSLRDKTLENMSADVELTPTQNNSIIHSLNYQVMKQFGRV